MNRAVGALPAILIKNRRGMAGVPAQKKRSKPLPDVLRRTSRAEAKTLVWLKGGELKAERMLWANSGNILVI
jgi:hypothetical protein